MLTNKLNQIYKPNRILFYKEASDEDIQAFYKGETGEIALYIANELEKCGAGEIVRDCC